MYCAVTIVTMQSQGGMMYTLTTRDIPPEVHAALRSRAQRHNRSMSAEVRTILQDVLLPTPPQGEGLGDRLVSLTRSANLTQEEWEEFTGCFTHQTIEPIEL